MNFPESTVSPLGGDVRRESVKSTSSPLSTSDAQNIADKDTTSVPQLPRESGDGASVPSEIESTNATGDGRRITLSTARNGSSLFDDDDEDDEDESH